MNFNKISFENIKYLVRSNTVIEIKEKYIIVSAHTVKIEKQFSFVWFFV